MFNKQKIDFINGIQYLRLDDITNNKCTLEGLKRLNPMFNEYNPMTYTIYLKSRPDLPDHEKLYYTELINRLLSKERQIVDEALNILEDKTNIVQNQPIEIKYE
jgi:hypothetical protein